MQNIRKLLKGRVDIFPLEAVVGYTLIHENVYPPQDKLITNHPKPVNIADYYLIVSKNIPEEKAQKILDDYEDGLKVSAPWSHGAF